MHTLAIIGSYIAVLAAGIFVGQAVEKDSASEKAAQLHSDQLVDAYS
jgi:hypothetical protein